MFRPGSSEVIAGRAIAAGFQGVDLGATLRFGGRDWMVVGLFDAGRSGFDSEIWADAEQLMQPSGARLFSSVIVQAGRCRPTSRRLRELIDDDPRLALEAKREERFYAEQSEALANFIRILGTALAVIFSIGAVVGATITMFGAVASRVGEIGTLRALGFRRSAVLAAFLGESLLLSLLGGVVGVAAALADAGGGRVDDQFRHLRRTGLPVPHDAGDRRCSRWCSRCSWASSAASCRPGARRG